MKLALSLLVFFTATSFAAAPAKIVAKLDSKTVEIALDAQNNPRVDGASDSYPTIKDFDAKYSEYEDFCYVGKYRETRALFAQLVYAANGDGDSYAELQAIKQDEKVFTQYVLPSPMKVVSLLSPTHLSHAKNKY